MELRFDGLYSRGAAIGRRSISGILLALAPLVPGCLGACIWKMKAKHHKKLPGRLHRPRNRRAVDLASYNGEPQTLLCRGRVTERQRESYTGPSNWKYEPWYKTPARVTFNLSICLVFDCILWVWVSVLGFDAARDPPESWLPSVIRDQDGIKRNNKHTTHSEIISDCFSHLSPAHGRLLSPTQWDVNIGPHYLNL